MPYFTFFFLTFKWHYFRGEGQDENPQTRYSEIDTRSVLLVKNIIELNNQITIQFLDNNFVVIDSNNTIEQIKEISINLQQNIVDVADYKAPKTLKKDIYFLKNYLYLGSYDDDVSLISVGIVDNNGEIKTMNKGEININNKKLYYNNVLGYYIKGGSH